MKTTLRSLTAVLFLLALMSFQLIKTQLTITIRNELGNTESGTTVRLFETEDDYKAETNAVAEGKTDAKGVVKFKELKAISYFVIASKDDKAESKPASSKQTASTKLPLLFNKLYVGMPEVRT
jgi:uncharacterized protein (DUF2141 family)